MLQSSPIKHADSRGGKGGGVERKLAQQNDILTLFKELRHDVLVMVGRLDFFCNVRPGIFQVFCDAAKFQKLD